MYDMCNGQAKDGSIALQPDNVFHSTRCSSESIRFVAFTYIRTCQSKLSTRFGDRFVLEMVKARAQ